MRHELVQRRELPLADTVQVALHLHAEVFVATRRLQRHGVVADLDTPHGLILGVDVCID